MCGIAGFTHLDQGIERTTIDRIVKSLHHRGPDQDRVYVSPSISLGVVRLKVIDLEGGDQPFISADNSAVLAFNGEIYNHQELRRELEARGRRFRSRCDTEIVLQAFLEWDSACFAKLRGMFAVAIWLERDKRLILARDRLGIKPLYLYRRGSEIHFGSELKAILGHPEIPRQLDHYALSDFLSVNYVPGLRTLIRGLTKLPPGSFLEYRDGACKIDTYWELKPTLNRDLSVEEAREDLDYLLRRAVREHLSSDVPIGIWLSGGLDSSTILNYVCEAGVHRPTTLSVAFESQCCDETRYFREMATRYGTDHHEFELSTASNLTSAVEELAFHSDEPGADAGALPVWFLSAMTSRYVTVALSGDGGDELFGGYATYLADRFGAYLRLLPAVARRLALAAVKVALPRSDRKISFEYKAKRLLEGSLLPADEAHMFWNGAFSPEQKQTLLLEYQPHRPAVGLWHELPDAVEIGDLNRYMLFDQQAYLPDNILYKVDRISMAHSIEVRPPFLDHRIVEFAASLPQSMKIRGTSQKYLLKQTMKGKLPSSILNRSKQGFDVPTHKWFRGVLKSFLLDNVSQAAVEQTHIFHWDYIRQLIEGHMERRFNVGYHLWGLLMLFLWLKRWNVDTSSEIESTAPPIHAAEC